MKICVATSTTARVGGAESYLGDVLGGLLGAGHDLALLCESDPPEVRESIVPAARRDEISVLAPGASREPAAMIDRLNCWRPDLLFAHGLEDPSLEAALVRAAPSVWFVHGYHGTCIPGMKRHAFPTLRPCSRTFGPACLAHYFPRRCGGLDPRTMWRMYRVQQRRLRMLRKCDAVVTTSAHMYDEYLRHGIGRARLHRITFYPPQDAGQRGTGLPVLADDGAPARKWDRTLARVSFVGRLDRNKGAHLLIEAAPLAARALGRRVRVSVVGDGPERAALQRQAAQVESRDANVAFDFEGWLGHGTVAAHLERHADLLVVPSVWPEPFGLVGLEAGRHGMPAAAFAVGGIPTWLHDGANGFLARADPPTAESLAVAIVKCLGDEATYRRLCRGAVESVRRFNREVHLSELNVIFDQVLARRRAASSPPSRGTISAFSGSTDQ